MNNIETPQAFFCVNLLEIPIFLPSVADKRLPFSGIPSELSSFLLLNSFFSRRLSIANNFRSLYQWLEKTVIKLTVIQLVADMERSAQVMHFFEQL